MKATKLTARDIFRIRYPEGSKNFMTPTIIRYGKISSNVAYELSSGRGIGDGPLYGVTVVKYDERLHKAESLYNLSKAFSTRSSAESYIKTLMG